MLEDVLHRRPYNAVTDFVDANVARGLGGKIAFTDSERSLTYAELQARSCRFAAALKALGLREENRVILLFHDTVDFPVAFWGAIRAGIIPIPINTLLTAEQYAYLFADSRAAATVVASPLAPTVLSIRDRLPHLREVIVVGASAEDGRSCATSPFFEDVLGRGRADAVHGADDVGRSRVLDVHVGLDRRSQGGEARPHQPDGDRAAHGPGRHRHPRGRRGVLGGEAVVLLRARQCPVVPAVGRRRARCCCRTGRRRRRCSTPCAATARPSSTPCPRSTRRCLRIPTSARAQAPIGCGCAFPRARRCRPISASAGATIVGVDVLDGIGSTEMLQTFLSNRPGDVRYGSTGKPVPGYDVKIVDENGRELPHGEIGELVVRGPSAGEGYWNQRAKSRRTFAGEWTYTGDKYLRDQDGYYYYCGRTDDMFKVNGMWVSPFEVEAALVSHEAVLEAAVIGKEDRDGLVKPKAFIVLKNGYAADEQLLETLRGHVKDRAGPWKYPRWIDIRPDLPRTATGKIQRFKLRD